MNESKAPAVAARGVSKRKVSAARLAAAKVLRRVEDGAFASVLLATETEELRVDDRALCYELVLGALRWQLWLDKAIEAFAGRASATLDAPVRHALRLGLYQLRFLDRTPASAAVNESVNLMYQARLKSAAGFVNAVLRRAAREPEYDPTVGINDPLERLSVAASHPRWMIERWVNSLGYAETEALASANNQTPNVAFRINNRINNRSNAPKDESTFLLNRLREGGLRVQASSVAPGAWRIVGDGSGRSLTPFVEANQVYVQSEASQLVAHVLAAQPGERVLDVCAAPGSKTTHIAQIADDAATVIAGDVSASRLAVLRCAVRQQNLESVQILQFNSEDGLPFAGNVFDAVLVDAPCSGTGTLRHNPEIRWRISNFDIHRLAERQRQILARAAPVVRPGGRLIYSTCSLEPEENERVVAAFCDEHQEFNLIPLVAVPEAVRTSSGATRTWPHKHNTEGFYIAALARCR